MKITIAERIKLHGLGYTREDIDAMINEPDPEPAATPQENPAPAATPQENPAPEQAVNDQQALLGALNDIKTQLQQMAIQNSTNPSVNPEQSVSDILNNLINKVKE